jgi:hypothetical protein
MRELIDELKKLNEKLDSDSEEVSQIAKKYGFGSVAWQDAMMARIKRKLENKEELTGVDLSFIETQAMHNAGLMDELKSMGFKDGVINAN